MWFHRIIFPLSTIKNAPHCIAVDYFNNQEQNFPETESLPPVKETCL